MQEVHAIVKDAEGNDFDFSSRDSVQCPVCGFKSTDPNYPLIFVELSPAGGFGSVRWYSCGCVSRSTFDPDTGESHAEHLKGV